MKCKHNKNQIGKLNPLPGDKEVEYLVPLSFRHPKTIYGWPLFTFRNYFLTHVKIYFSDVRSITWSETKYGWSVKLASGYEIDGLDSIEPFINLKNTFYSDIKQQ